VGGRNDRRSQGIKPFFPSRWRFGNSLTTLVDDPQQDNVWYCVLYPVTRWSQGLHCSFRCLNNVGGWKRQAISHQPHENSLHVWSTPHEQRLGTVDEGGIIYWGEGLGRRRVLVHMGHIYFQPQFRLAGWLAGPMFPRRMRERIFR